MRNIIRLLFLFALVLVLVIAITGCQPQVTPEIPCEPETPCEIEITSPELWESLDGNATYEISWVWIGPTNKEVNITLIGLTEDEIELGTIPIASNVLGSDGSYIWGPNFGADIWTSFEDWPWWFKVKIEVIGEETEALSEVFAVQWWNPEWD